jgi:hypothetical protein
VRHVIDRPALALVPRERLVLGELLDDRSHVRAEFGGDALLRPAFAVLDHVVQQPRDDHVLFHAEAREHYRDVHRVNDVRNLGAAGDAFAGLSFVSDERSVQRAFDGG